jgi:hypothetical protein
LGPIILTQEPLDETALVDVDLFRAALIRIAGLLAGKLCHTRRAGGR